MHRTAPALVEATFVERVRLAVAGFLAGYSGFAREPYVLDLRQFATRCRGLSWVPGAPRGHRTPSSAERGRGARPWHCAERNCHGPPALRGPSCAGFVGKGLSQGGGGMCVRAGATSIPLSVPFDIAVASAVKTISAKARPKRCPRPGRRSDQAPPINDRASAGRTTRSWRSPPTSSRRDCSTPPAFTGSKPAVRINRSTSSPARSSSVA
jgi:hypothetical protein